MPEENVRRIEELEFLTNPEDETTMEEDINTPEEDETETAPVISTQKDGSVIIHDYSSPRWTAEYPDCSMPMTFDTYSNCSFGCIYCFSQFQRGIGSAKGKYLRKEVHAVSVDRIKKIFLEPDDSQFGNYIKARKVMQWGGLSDQFDEFERRYGVTLELLKFFREIDYPIEIKTRDNAGGIVLTEEINGQVPIQYNAECIFQCSLI